MKVLGAILAGGKATRFGSDKALAVLDGRTLIAHAAASLAAQCDAVIVVGRAQDGYHCIEDRPAREMGPLAGLAGALAFAAAGGFANVLSVGVDAPGIPASLRVTLGPAPAFVINQPVIGYWPVSALRLLDEILASNERHSMLHFVERLGARGVVLHTPPANINTQADLENLGHKT
jgi:molybdenum cofactor guanylyltransferase